MQGDLSRESKAGRGSTDQGWKACWRKSETTSFRDAERKIFLRALTEPLLILLQPRRAWKVIELRARMKERGWPRKAMQTRERLLFSLLNNPSKLRGCFVLFFFVFRSSLVLVWLSIKPNYVMEKHFWYIHIEEEL